MDTAQLIYFAIQFVIILGNLITYAIIGRIIVSWLSMGRPGPRGRFSQILIDVTEPFISIARKIPHRIGMIDLSPLIALIGIDLLSGTIAALLASLI
ncbi:YggT family protein [Candidatus Peregrinibacteria bacterium]|nr:YggT family protein [Candidatus Peregrinibacteria bacterium]